MRKTSPSGFTLVEAIAAMTIIAIVGTYIAGFFKTGTKSLTKMDVRVQSQEDLLRTMVKLERDFWDMGLLERAQTSEIVYRMDSYRMPNYNPDARDPNNIPFEQSPDDDGDALQIVDPNDPAVNWKVGYDYQDDDDDNDPGKNVDVRCRYRLSGDQLIREFQFNQPYPLDDTRWGNKEVLVDHISLFQLTYFGSSDRVIARNNTVIDYGHDGDKLTIDGDGSQGDNIVDAIEIDAVLPPDGDGNNNGVLFDTPGELSQIRLIRLVIAQDKNRDGVEDFRMETDFTPNFLTLRNL